MSPFLLTQQTRAAMGTACGHLTPSTRAPSASKDPLSCPGLALRAEVRSHHQEFTTQPSPGREERDTELCPEAITCPVFRYRWVPVPGRADGRGLLQPPEGRHEDAGPGVRHARNVSPRHLQPLAPHPRTPGQAAPGRGRAADVQSPCPGRCRGLSLPQGRPCLAPWGPAVPGARSRSEASRPGPVPT